MDEFDICGCGSCDECVPAYDDGGDDWMKEEAEVEKASWLSEEEKIVDEKFKEEIAKWEKEENEKIEKAAREEFIRDNGREPTEEELAIKGNEIWYRWWVV